MESLPFNDEPEIFGMHENANIAFQVRILCMHYGSSTGPGFRAKSCCGY